MNKEKKLLLQRNIFVMILFIAFGTIIISEKSAQFLLPKAEEKIKSYFEEHYEGIKEEVSLGKATYQNQKYQMKVTSKENKDYYFIITYKNKKYSSTYKEDYVKGKTFLKKLETKLTKKAQEKTNKKTKVQIPLSLDKYTEKVKERIIKEEDLFDLKFYKIKTEITEQWDSTLITNQITEFITNCEKYGMNPKSYTFTITDKNEITQSVEISNVTNEWLNNSEKEQIISDIIKKKESKLLKENKISYQYLNEGGQ